jgi:anaerobic magnesium-protoporphyrin IX monomethyl ester cyclase
MKKSILIAPANDFAGNQNVVRFTTLLAPPMGVLALGSYLNAHDVPVELIDVQVDFGFGLNRQAEHVVHQRVAQYLCEQADDIAWVGVSQLSNASSGIALAREIHRVLPGMPIFLGGYFPSSAYEKLLGNYPFISGIVRGDGERAALCISQDLDRGRSPLRVETPNLVWRTGQEIRGSLSEPMKVDGLPILDFRLLRNPRSYQIIDLVTSRGCPFHCNYCLEGSMRPYGAYSPRWVDSQLTHLEQVTPNDRVFIYDPVFGLGRERTLEMCCLLRGRRFRYALESRVDVLPIDLIPVLHDAGVETIFLGIESASPSTLMRMNKVPSVASAKSYLGRALEVLEACFRSGITPVIGLMLGYPGDSKADYGASLDFVEQVNRLCDRVAVDTELEPGFVPLAFHTKIYDGTALAGQMATEYPEVQVRTEPFIGEQMVLSSSVGLDLEVTELYQAEIVRLGQYTPLALQRLGGF